MPGNELAFINGMTPGISGLVKSLADDTATQKGQMLGAQYLHEMAGARKANADARKINDEIENRDRAALDYALANAGVDGASFNTYRDSVRAGKDPIARGSDVGPMPGLPAQNEEKLRNAMRTEAAMRTGKYHDVAQGEASFAQLPAIRAAVDAATRNDANSLADIQRNQAALGHNVLQDHTPADVRTFEWFNKQSPETQRSFRELQTALNASKSTQVNMPSGFQTIVGPGGKPVVVGVGKNGDQRMVGEVPPKQPSTIQEALIPFLLQSIADGMNKGSTNAAPVTKKKPTTSGW